MPISRKSPATGAEEGNPTAPPSTVSAAAEAACGTMIECWRQGDRRPVERFLQRWTDPPHADEVFELVYLEFLIREQLGQAPLDDLAGRFPALAVRLRRQVAIHEAINIPDSQVVNVPVAQASPPPNRPRAAGPGWPTLPGYQVERLLGQGTIGTVYQAREVQFNRVVALKLVPQEALGPPAEFARIRAEVEAIGRWAHPNVVPVEAISEHGGQACFEMAFVAGGSLADELDGTPRPPHNASSLLRIIARVLHEAHTQGIIHRNLKPSNILLQPNGTPRVADFGLARRGDLTPDPCGTATPGESWSGSSGYLAPEQVAAATAIATAPLTAPTTIGPAADIYALGLIYYEMLTGRPPFRTDTPLSPLELVRQARPVPPSKLRPGIPRDVETICLKCLAQEPSRRYRSAAALADDLGFWLRGKPIRARQSALREWLGAWLLQGWSLPWLRRWWAGR